MGNRAAGGGGGGVNSWENDPGTPGRAGNTSTIPNYAENTGNFGGLASNGVAEIGGGGGGGTLYRGAHFDSYQVSTGRGGHAAGGIYNSGILTLLGTEFSGNLGAGGGGGSGFTDAGPHYYSGNGGTGVGALWNAGGSVRLDASTEATLTAQNAGAGGKIETNTY